MTSAIGNRRGPSAATALRRGLAAAILVCLVGPPLVAAAPPVRLETTGGEAVSGGLRGITADEVTLEVDGRSRGWPVGQIRRLLRTDAAVAAPVGVVVTLVDGGSISGDDFSWTDDRAAVARPAGNVELSIDRIASVAWRRQEGNADWQSAVPEKPESDLVVVARAGADGEAFEFVECAITRVTPETVTVVLDGETIPVKRAKVIGLQWLREPRPAGGTRVEIVGGELAAAAVAWSEAGLVLDDVIRIPAADVRLVDYAAGRTVRLSALQPERTAGEPFFGGLAGIDGVAGFFAPRFVPPPAGDASGADRVRLVVRPRTTMTWRIPADSRRFVTSVSPVGGRQASGGTQVTIALDDKPVWERRVEAAEQADGLPVQIDVPDGRRLTITVDFVDGTMGCPVRFLDPVFEK